MSHQEKVVERVGALLEAGGRRIASQEGTGGPKYRIRVMGWDEGADVAHGSSADYPVEVIKRDFAATFPEGTRMRANHDGICEAGGDVRRIMAKTIGTIEYEADGAYVDIQVAREWADFFEDFADTIGVSISAAGILVDVDEDAEDYDPEAAPVVERFLSQEEYPYSTIDFVEAPGADGRIVAALESARDKFQHLNPREAATFASRLIDEARARKTSEAAPPRSPKKENAMDEQELNAIVERAAAAGAAKAIESLTPAPAETEDIRMENVAEAAFKAGLSEGSRTAVYARVASGESVEEAIAAEKAREDEIEARVTERLKQEQGHGGYAVGEGAGTPAADLSEFERTLEFSLPTPKAV